DLGQRPCLKIEPEELDFGVVPPRCSTTELPIAVSNVCSEPLRVKGITFFHDAFPQFFEGWMPLFPRDLDPGADFDFNVFFRPDGTGFFEGHVEIVVVPVDSDGNEGDPIVYPVRLYGEGRHEAIQTDTWTQEDHAKVDVLWVIDNSGSMYEEQVLLSQQIPNFMSFAIEQKIDFHIGVTTTGVAYFPVNSPFCETGFNGDEDGRLFPHPNEGRPRFVHAGMSEATAVETLRANLQVGWCHALRPSTRPCAGPSRLPGCTCHCRKPGTPASGGRRPSSRSWHSTRRWIPIATGREIRTRIAR